MKKLLWGGIIATAGLVVIITLIISGFFSAPMSLEAAIKTHCDERGLNDIYHTVIKQTENSVIVLIVHENGVENSEFRFTFERLCMWKESWGWEVIGYREWPQTWGVEWWI